jgi:hypothetical protein
MNYGKEVCHTLKEIRRDIAKKNNIDLVTSDCHFEGECLGYCPKCDSELRYLENEIHKRKHLGKAAAIAGISLGVATIFSSCLKGEPVEPTITGDMPPECIYENNISENDTVSLDAIKAEDEL